MSNTTVINSKAIQALLAQAENQPGESNGASFHQLLEGALTEKARAETSPAALAKSTLGDEPTLGALSTKLARTLTASATAHKPDAAKQLATPNSKAPASAAAAANDDAPAAPGAKSPAAGAAKASVDSGKLDATQLKLVNAPALPESTAAVAHPATTPAAARSLPAEAPRSTQTVGPQTLSPATTSSLASSVAPRGFAAALANAHVANALPPSLADQVGLDPSLRLSVTPQAAHLSMDTGATGPLIAQLRITNGVADVRLTGDAASLLARHGAELSLGLTAAGLQPGRVEITAPSAGADLQSATSDGTGAGAFRSDAQTRDGSETQDHDQPRAARLAERPITAASSTPVGRASRVHVKA